MDRLLTLSKINPDISSSVGDLLVIGINDLGCPKCGLPQFIAVPATARGGSEALLICRDCSHIAYLHDSATQVQFVVEDRVNLIIKHDSPVSASRRMAALLEAQPDTVPASQVHASGSRKSATHQVALDAEDPPEGYRTVSWIREYEADLILSSYTNQRGYNLKSDEGTVFFETEFYPPDSSEAIKFRAQVLAIRIRKSGRRNVGWIRREEAQAVLDSYIAQQDVEFLHTQFGRGGLVQYFPSESPLVSKYRSQTRLLRRR